MHSGHFMALLGSHLTRWAPFAVFIQELLLVDSWSELMKDFVAGECAWILTEFSHLARFFQKKGDGYFGTRDGQH